MSTPLKQDVGYRIDERDVIVWVNEPWRRFAVENGAPNLASDVIGTTLWSHITGDPVRLMLRSIVARVRWQQVELEFPFCCDSPDRKREMVMTLRPLPSAHVEFTSTTVEERVRPPIGLLAPAAHRSRDLLLMCSWCNRVNVGEWMEVEEAVDRLRLFDRESFPRISHGICMDCEAVVRATAPLRRAA